VYILFEGASTMDNTTLATIFWIAAGAMLTLYLLRRRKRKMSGK
jgi:energy-converting hydrogenase Eha subunit E